MRKADVGEWLTTIHGTPDKRQMEGIETERLAIQFLETSGEIESITLPEMRLIYEQEFSVHPWSVNYDFQACGVAWANMRRDRPALGMVMDYIFYTRGTVHVTSTQDDLQWMAEMSNRAMGGQRDVRALVMHIFNMDLFVYARVHVCVYICLCACLYLCKYT